MTGTLFFNRTDTFNGKVIEHLAADPFYAVHEGTGTGDIAFRGWVSGGHGSFRFFAEGGDHWGPVGRTRKQAVDRYYAKVAADAAAQAEREARVPSSVYTVRLTADNLADEATNLVGALLEGAEDLGPMRNVRLTFDGYQNAMCVGENGRDVLGLPSTVTAYRFD